MVDRFQEENGFGHRGMAAPLLLYGFKNPVGPKVESTNDISCSPEPMRFRMGSLR